jgi:hypothetical protein
MASSRAGSFDGAGSLVVSDAPGVIWPNIVLPKSPCGQGRTARQARRLSYHAEKPCGQGRTLYFGSITLPEQQVFDPRNRTQLLLPTQVTDYTITYEQ